VPSLGGGGKGFEAVSALGGGGKGFEANTADSGFTPAFGGGGNGFEATAEGFGISLALIIGAVAAGTAAVLSESSKVLSLLTGASVVVLSDVGDMFLDFLAFL
jgi:hypothetical protein